MLVQLYLMFARIVLCLALSSHLVIMLVTHTENLIDKRPPCVKWAARTVFVIHDGVESIARLR